MKIFNRSKKTTRALSLSGLGQLAGNQLQSAEAWMESITGLKYIYPEKIKRLSAKSTGLWLLVGGLGLFSVLLLRLADVQLVTGDRLLTAATANRIRDEISYAPRGTIRDRNGLVLAQNRAQYQLSVTPYLLAADEADRVENYQVIAKHLGISATDLKEKAEEQGLRYSLPILIADRLEQTTVLKLEQELPGLSGFSVDVVPVREYVADAGLAHILGYVGRVSKEDLERREDILPTDFVGRSGVEQQYDHILRGTNGRSRIEVDALGRPIRLLAKQNAEEGTDITLTIDYNLQLELEKQVKQQMEANGVSRGSAVMLDPDSGEILAMVSLPAYDNNLFARGITSAEYQNLLDDPNQPLLNKAIAAAYPSGSTVKPILAAAALHEGVIDTNTIIVDRGAIQIRHQHDPSITYTFRTWNPSGLGALDVKRALALSSNVYFYAISGGYGDQKGLGIERVAKYLRNFGLGSRTGVDLPGEVTGRVPDAEWKQQTKGEQWYLGDTYNLSIGQGDLKVTPLQMAVVSAAVSNGGKLVTPHVFKSANQYQSELDWPQRRVLVDNQHLQTVREGMQDMIYNGSYCACRFTGIPERIAGKTGTAQTDPGRAESYPHAWFISYAPWEKPQVAMTIMLEHGRRSAITLDPAINIFTYFFESH